MCVSPQCTCSVEVKLIYQVKQKGHYNLITTLVGCKFAPA